jgi:hypothetical protein
MGGAEKRLRVAGAAAGPTTPIVRQCGTSERAITLAGRVADAVLLLTQAMAQTIGMQMAFFQARCHLPLEEARAAAEGALTTLR